MAYISKTEDELETIAQDLYAGRIFCDRQVRSPKEITMVFMIMIFLGQDDIKRMREDKIDLIYEYMSEAGPRSCNGMPCFFSMRTLDQADTRAMLVRYEQIKTFMEARSSNAVSAAG